MKHTVYIICLGLVLFLGQEVYGQTLSRSVIGATGSVNNQLSYTVGETVIETGSSGMLVLTQGFQQPDKLTGTFNDPLLGNVKFILYPNPTQDQLILELTIDKPQKFGVEMIDLRGRRVGALRELAPASQVMEIFSVESLAEGTYVLLLKNASGQILEQMRFRKLD